MGVFPIRTFGVYSWEEEGFHRPPGAHPGIAGCIKSVQSGNPTQPRFPGTQRDNACRVFHRQSPMTCWLLWIDMDRQVDMLDRYGLDKWAITWSEFKSTTFSPHNSPSVLIVILNENQI